MLESVHALYLTLSESIQLATVLLDSSTSQEKTNVNAPLDMIWIPQLELVHAPKDKLIMELIVFAHYPLLLEISLNVDALQDSLKVLIMMPNVYVKILTKL